MPIACGGQPKTMNTTALPATGRMRHRADDLPLPMDRTLLFIVLGMLVLGLVMAFSSTLFYLDETSGTLVSQQFMNQLFAAGIGLAGMLVISRVDYAIWRRFALPIMAVVLLLLVAVLFTQKTLGASRWLFDRRFQPSELAKGAMVIYGATWLASRRDQLGSFLTGLLPFGLIVGITALLIIVEPDFGTTSVVVAISVMMFFLAGASLKHFLAVGATAGVTGALAYPVLMSLFPHAAARVANFAQSTDPNYWQNHVPQAKIAFALGHFFGSGLGSSSQKQGFLPLPQTDSILAVLGEELGLLGLILTLALFALFAWRCLAIARSADSHFGAFICVGVMTWLVVQLCINALSLMEVIPFTGIPVPFLSIGGTSLVSVMAACGLVLSVSRGSRRLAMAPARAASRVRAQARPTRGDQGEGDALSRGNGRTRAPRTNRAVSVTTNADVPVLVGRDIRVRRTTTSTRGGAVRREPKRNGGGARPTR